MVDDVNRTLVVAALLVVVGAFAAGAWLTNYGGGPNGPAAGGNVDPNDWGAAASAICSDTNSEVVDLAVSLGPEIEPADVLSRGEQILGRRAEGLEALPAPAEGAASVDELVSEMRAIQAVMQRVRDALDREDEEQAYRLGLGLESKDLTRLAYELDVPWCDLFGADDETIRTTASFNVLEAQDLLELHRQETGTYSGADIAGLRAKYTSDLVPGEVTISRASASSYCVETTVGYLTVHVSGPDALILPGSCS